MFRGYFRYFAAVSLNGIFMKENKLYRLLSSLSDDEWKAFEKFTASPYFNLGRNYLPLFKLFRAYTKKANPRGLPDDETIYSKLYPGKPFNKSVISTMLSGFTKLTESFLVQTDYDTFGEGKEIALLRQFEKRNFDDLLLKEVALKMKKNEDKPFDLYKLEFFKSIQDYLVRTSYKSIYDKKIESPVIRRADYSFFVFYLNMLNEERDLRVMKSMLNKNNPGRLSALMVKNISSDYVLSYIEENYPSLSGTLGLLIRCYVSRDYYEIKELFIKNYQQLEATLARNISYVIEGLLFDLLAEGKREYLRERFLFIKFCMENDLLVDKRSGIIPAQPVDNAIYYALWNKEYEWLVFFINKYKKALPADIKNELMRYANLCVLYGKKMYKEALKEIKMMGNASFAVKWRVRSIELQILFEIKDFESIDFAVDNFQKFIRNEKVSEHFEKMLKANINAYKAFIKAYQDNNTAEYSFIAKKLSDEIPSQFGDWILEKISGMNN